MCYYETFFVFFQEDCEVRLTLLFGVPFEEVKFCSRMAGVDADREKVLQDYRKKLLEHKEVESRLKESEYFSSLKLSNHVGYFVSKCV